MALVDFFDRLGLQLNLKASYKIWKDGKKVHKCYLV